VPQCPIAGDATVAKSPFLWWSFCSSELTPLLSDMSELN